MNPKYLKRSLLFLFIVMILPKLAFSEAEQVWQYWWEGDWPQMEVSDSGYACIAIQQNNAITVARYNKWGWHLWSQTVNPSSGYLVPNAIAIDDEENVYIGGWYNPNWYDGVSYDPVTQYIFLLKYAPDGTYLWDDIYEINGVLNTKQNGNVSDIEVSNDGYVYIYGNTGIIPRIYPPDWSAGYSSYDAISDRYSVLIKYNKTTGAREWAIEEKIGPDNDYPAVEVSGLKRDNFGLKLLSSGELLLCGKTVNRQGWCQDTLQNDSTHWIEYGVFVASVSSQGDINNVTTYTGIDSSDACSYDDIYNWSMLIWDMELDDLGNVYLSCFHRDSVGAVNNQNYLLKFDPGLALDWSKRFETSFSYPVELSIYDNNKVVLSQTDSTVILNSSGDILWKGGRGFFADTDNENNLFVGWGYDNTIEFYDHNGIDEFPEWSFDITGDVHRMIVDSVGDVYVLGRVGWTTYTIAKYSQNHYLRLWDAHDQPICNTEFELYKIHNDPPYYSEDTLGNFISDSANTLAFPLLPNDKMIFPVSAENPEPDTLSRGDTLRIARLVTDSNTVKHPHLTDKMYSIQLDNLNFDSLGGTTYDTIKTGQQHFVIDHAEIRYNLVVSVFWDASLEYLQSLEASFQSMSNYLYDVTDGQVRLDTVLIYDDSAHWDDADLRIIADNQQWPKAFADSINSAGVFTISLPRKWYGNADITRNQTYYDHPLDLNEPKDYRTKAHEFGHYAFGFYDEYVLWDNTLGKYVVDNTLRCIGIPYYGFMEYQYPHHDPYTSEMSNEYHYSDDLCKNTKQYGVNGASCWGYFESKFEGDYITDTNDTLFVEIFTPNDTNRNAYAWPSGFVYLEGPNNDMTSPMTLDYDVGSKVVFPVSPANPAPGIKEVDAEIRVGGTPQAKAEVFLMKYLAPLTYDLIKQGKTADNGRIWVLGAKNGDVIKSAGFNQTVTKANLSQEIWNSGEITIDADSMTLDLSPVDGYFPVISEVTLNEASFDLQLINATGFSSLPNLTYQPSTGGQYDYIFNSIADGYGTTLTESSGLSGNITINAEDNSSNPFFFINSYTHSSFTPSETEIEFFGPAGESQILFNDSNETMSQAMLLSSPYTIIRTGLAEANIQASNTYSLSVYPEGSMTGNGLFRINYSEGDLVTRGGSIEDEASLKIFRWIDKSAGWQEIGGSVDTILNQVVETITEPGVYAAFTTDGSVGVIDEQGSVLPYRFELSQNYPNPFNPLTIISYNLPKRSDVTIEIFNILGQKVITLLDENKPAGEYQIEWNGTDSNGQEVSTGIYFYRFQAGEYTDSRKMMLLK